MQEILVTTSHTSAHTDCRGGGGEAGQPVGMGVFGKFSLARIVWQCCTSNPCFLEENYIDDEQQDKEQERAREKPRKEKKRKFQ